MTYNIRYDNPGDGENNWHKRKVRLLNEVQFLEPDFLGTQEALLHQLQYLDSGLVDYEFVGVGRDDGKEAGEFSALFYNEARYELLNSGTFWLSNTPNEPSKGWDAAIKRVCSYGQFRRKGTGRVVWVFNTHFDHRGEEARKESAKLIIEKINGWTKAEDKVVLMGDLNLRPETEPIQYLSRQMKDARHCVSCVVSGSEETWNGFAYDAANAGNRIDYIFTSNLEVSRYAVFSQLINGRFNSDHFPVYIEFSLY